MKKIISALMAGAMLFSGVSAMASDINITINDELFIPKNASGEVVYPFIENGSTYLPVRAMSEATGKEVAFDAENYAVYIGVKPMEADAIREPYALVGDTVYYYDELDYIGSLEGAKEIEAFSVLAKEKIGQAAIEARYNETLESYGEMSTQLTPAHKKYLYVIVCEQLLLENTPLEDTDYENFVTAKHILVEDEALAVEIIESLDKGTAMEELIEMYNTDPGQTKGSTYTFTYGEMVEEFEKAAFELGEGEYTKEPVATAYGYHIIKRLPLVKTQVDGTAIKINRLLKELENVKVEKAVGIIPSADYGMVDGRIVTTKELDAFRSVAGDVAYSVIFDNIRMYVALKNYCENEGIVTPDEVDVVRKNLTEEGLDFSAMEDSEKIEYYTNLIAYTQTMLMKWTGDTEEFIALAQAEAEKLDSQVFKQIKVFVDGKLIVPCDVNNNYVKPQNIGGTVYVPVRAIVEALGMTADWNNDTRTVVITK